MIQVPGRKLFRSFIGTKQTRFPFQSLTSAVDPPQQSATRAFPHVFKPSGATSAIDNTLYYNRHHQQQPPVGSSTGHRL